MLEINVYYLIIIEIIIDYQLIIDYPEVQKIQ